MGHLLEDLYLVDYLSISIRTSYEAKFFVERLKKASGLNFVLTELDKPYHKKQITGFEIFKKKVTFNLSDGLGSYYIIQFPGSIAQVFVSLVLNGFFSLEPEEQICRIDLKAPDSFFPNLWEEPAFFREFFEAQKIIEEEKKQPRNVTLQFKPFTEIKDEEKESSVYSIIYIKSFAAGRGGDVLIRAYESEQKACFELELKHAAAKSFLQVFSKEKASSFHQLALLRLSRAIQSLAKVTYTEGLFELEKRIAINLREVFAAKGCFIPYTTIAPSFRLRIKKQVQKPQEKLLRRSAHLQKIIKQDQLVWFSGLYPFLSLGLKPKEILILWFILQKFLTSFSRKNHSSQIVLLLNDKYLSGQQSFSLSIPSVTLVLNDLLAFLGLEQRASNRKKLSIEIKDLSKRVFTGKTNDPDFYQENSLFSIDPTIEKSSKLSVVSVKLNLFFLVGFSATFSLVPRKLVVSYLYLIGKKKKEMRLSSTPDYFFCFFIFFLHYWPLDNVVLDQKEFFYLPKRSSRRYIALSSLIEVLDFLGKKKILLDWCLYFPAVSTTICQKGEKQIPKSKNTEFRLSLTFNPKAFLCSQKIKGPL